MLPHALFERPLLVFSGLLALAIGVWALLGPASFHATSGIELGSDPALLSEIRAPAGALAALGSLMVAGAFSRTLRGPATLVGATVYLSYGLARLVAFALDGNPGPSLLGATAIELLLGTALGWVHLHGARFGRTTGSTRATGGLAGDRRGDPRERAI
jgi:hypothetical protein